MSRRSRSHSRERSRHNRSSPDDDGERRRGNRHIRKGRWRDDDDDNKHKRRRSHSTERHHRHHSLDKRHDKMKIKREPMSDDEQKRDREERRENERKRIEARRNREKTKEERNNPFSEEVRSGSKFQWGKTVHESKDETEGEQIDKEKPNFGLSGKLAVDTNLYNGVVIKYNEPPEARKPKVRWRLYPFKGEEKLPVLFVHRQSAYLIGRDRRVVDIPVDHPSCSKQHAALQYRCLPYTRPDGTKGRRIRPYIIDLGSPNGTHLNNQKIEGARYYELQEKDVIKFGFSSREYVILNEKSLEAEESNSEEETVKEEKE